MRSCTVKGGAFELAGLVCGVGGGTGGVSELVSATKSSSCDEERLKATQRCAFCPSTSTSGGSLCGGLGRRAAPPSSAAVAGAGAGVGAGAVAGRSTPGIKRAAQLPAPAPLRRPESSSGGSAAVSAWRCCRCCHRHSRMRLPAATASSSPGLGLGLGLYC